MASRIHVVGLGVEAGGRLSAPAEVALHGAEVVIGAERQLEWLRSLDPGVEALPPLAILPELSALEALLDKYAGEVVLLASGDPLYFGIGRWLALRYPVAQLKFYSALSSVQAACSRLGLALQDCIALSLHGRPLATLKRHLRNGRSLIILTDRNSHPQALASACVDAGLDGSTLWVCEQLGYPDERVRRFEVAQPDQLAHANFSDLQVSVLQLRGPGGLIPSFAGLDDTALVTDGEPGQGMISKREVRLQILSLLQTGENQVVWDVGAGCGGVSTELALWHPAAKIIAIEQHAARLACLEANRERYGNLNLDIVAGRAPEVLAELIPPDRVFIGGSDGELEPLLAYCWRRLAVDGVLVASAVTATTSQQLERFANCLDDVQVEALRLGVGRGERQDGQWQYREKRPVTLFRFNKTWSK